MTEFPHLPQDTIDNAFAATVHAPYDVTYAYRGGHFFSTHFKSLTPISYSLYTVSQKTFHLWLAVALAHVNRFLYFWQKFYR